MLTNIDISNFQERFQNLVALDQVQKAIDELIQWTRVHFDSNELLHEILVISSRYRRLRKEFMKGVIEFEVYDRLRTILMYKFLFVIDTIALSKSSNTHF